MSLESYIGGLSLSGPTRSTLEFARTEEPRALPADLKAAVDAGSLLSFVDGVSPDEREDVLFSVQLAQLAASGSYDRFMQARSWYQKYLEVLESLGWTVEQFAFAGFDQSDGELRMDKAALAIIAAIATQNQLAVLRESIKALEALADNDETIRLFDSHTSAETSGNFQIGAVQKGEGGSLSLALGAFHFRSAGTRRRFLFFSWGKHQVNFWTGAQKLTLNRSLYAVCRDAVRTKLGKSALDFIASLDIAPAPSLESVVTSTEEVESSVASPRARFALLVRRDDDPAAKAREIQEALAPLGATVRPLSNLERNILVAGFSERIFGASDAEAFEAAHVLREQFRLEAAEPDLPTNHFPEEDITLGDKGPARESIESLCFTPAQPELEPDWALKAMRVRDAWDYSIQVGRPDRGSGIIIAQPDTGVIIHPELTGVVQVDPRDVLDGDNDPTDPLEDVGNPGHGTGTGSVVVSSESGTVIGTAPLARHMPIRAIKSVIRITQVSVAEAIEWAVSRGAHVITMSLGGIPSFSLHRALRRAVAADVIVLAAAGNCVRTVVWPARYADCIAVAGVNSNGKPWKGSCRGSSVAVSAPGENVFRARVGNPLVGQGQGTSFAVALTAGVAGLWLAHHGRANLIAEARARNETLQEMFRRLVQATASRPPDWDSFNMGAGIVDARALLEADLDLNRGLEFAPQDDNAKERGKISVESLVLETLGEDAMPEPDLDWQQFGPEIANTLLRAQVMKSERGGEEAAFSVETPLSSTLETHPSAAAFIKGMKGGAQ